MKKKCYFFNVGVTFDKNNKKELKETWNCNSLCCKSDLSNGLWCEDYGIEFNKERTLKFIKDYVERGVDNTYGYIKEKEIDMPKDFWDELYKNLVENYNYNNINDAKKNGYIPYDYTDMIEDYSSYWEQPDISYIKTNNEILKNKLEVLKEEDLDKEIMTWINEELYGIVKDKEKLEIGGM